MILSGRYPTVGFYRVEVSGWDIDEVFFVEKADLEWREETGRRVKLRTPLRKGSVIFVRLLQTNAAARPYPMAYEVDPIGTEEEGLCEYHLKKVQSKTKQMSKTIH